MINTVPETNSLHLPGSYPAQKTNRPTVHFQVICEFQGGYLYIKKSQKLTQGSENSKVWVDEISLLGRFNLFFQRLLLLVSGSVERVILGPRQIFSRLISVTLPQKLKGWKLKGCLSFSKGNDI